MKLLLIWFTIFFSMQSIAQDITDAANKFISSLEASQKSKAQFKLDDDERFNWHFVPRKRNGITFHDLNENQRQAAMALLKASLSIQGYRKASGIIELEAILREVEGRNTNDNYRDPKNYYFSIFSIPSKEKPWGWRLEGHHISLNFISTSGEIISSTPSFFGANPAIVPRGTEKGKQVLQLEMELGFKLINSLSQNQLAIARFSETAPYDINTGNDRKAKLLTPEGLKYNDMNDLQKQIFLQLLDAYAKNYAFGFSSKLMDKIKKAGIDNLSFAWAGSLKPGAGHYYRIQGPMLLIEYDNTQNNANHIHTVVRDLTNDFAEDILREHYRKEH